MKKGVRLLTVQKALISLLGMVFLFWSQSYSLADVIGVDIHHDPWGELRNYGTFAEYMDYSNGKLLIGSRDGGVRLYSVDESTNEVSQLSIFPFSGTLLDLALSEDTVALTEWEISAQGDTLYRLKFFTHDGMLINSRQLTNSQGSYRTIVFSSNRFYVGRHINSTDVLEVYHRQSSIYTLAATISLVHGSDFDIEGDLMGVVGGGHVYTFEYENGEWVQKADFILVGGQRIDVDGERMVVMGSSEVVNFFNVYAKDFQGTWIPEAAVTYDRQNGIDDACVSGNLIVATGSGTVATEIYDFVADGSWEKRNEAMLHPASPQWPGPVQAIGSNCLAYGNEVFINYYEHVYFPTEWIGRLTKFAIPPVPNNYFFIDDSDSRAQAVSGLLVLHDEISIVVPLPGQQWENVNNGTESYRVVNADASSARFVWRFETEAGGTYSFKVNIPQTGSNTNNAVYKIKNVSGDIVIDQTVTLPGLISLGDYFLEANTQYEVILEGDDSAQGYLVADSLEVSL